MAKSRKDARGYALHKGECQRKDGRYSFSYTDREHKRHIIYASDLATLRSRERKIIRDIEDGMDPHLAERITINQVYDKYFGQKYDLKATTRANYIYTYDHFVREGFGKRKLASIKYTDVKKYYYDLILERGIKSATLDNNHTQLHPAFQMAVRDGLIRVNSSDGVMAEIKKSHVWKKEKRRSLTVPQQVAFMRHLNENNDFVGWRSVITVLLGTGMRIGECLGLRWEDLDFEARTISVNHNLVYRRLEKGEGMMKHINTPKTVAGTRTILMLKEVYDVFLDEYQFQRITGFCEEEVDGYSGFVFSSSVKTVMIPEDVNRAIQRVTDSYNKEGKVCAKNESREPLLIPHFSANHLRHTFCTRFCENETNLKVIQSIMGHADITTTMDIYAEATEEKKQEIIANLENKILIQ